MLGRILIATVRGYRLLVSPWTLPACRFTPTCSAYALAALEEHGAVRGSWLTLRRLGRCHPWGGHGYDPVPPAPVDATPAAATHVTVPGGADKMPVSEVGGR